MIQPYHCTQSLGQKSILVHEDPMQTNQYILNAYSGVIQL